MTTAPYCAARLDGVSRPAPDATGLRIETPPRSVPLAGIRVLFGSAGPAFYHA